MNKNNSPPNSPRTPSPHRLSRKSSPRSPQTPSSASKRSNIRHSRKFSNSDNRKKNSSQSRVLETHDALPILIEKPIPSSCDWWPAFAVKVTNLIHLLDSKDGEFDYVLTGSTAVALLTYFVNPESLYQLQVPGDGDVLIVPKDIPHGKRKVTFATLNLKRIGQYILPQRQYDEDSGTFEKEKTNQSSISFDSLDVNIEHQLNYIELQGIRIFNPQNLLDRYTEYRRDKNTKKIEVLEKINSQVMEVPGVTYGTYKMYNSELNSRRSRIERMAALPLPKMRGNLFGSENM